MYRVILHLFDLKVQEYSMTKVNMLALPFLVTHLPPVCTEMHSSKVTNGKILCLDFFLVLIYFCNVWVSSSFILSIINPSIVVLSWLVSVPLTAFWVFIVFCVFFFLFSTSLCTPFVNHDIDMKPSYGAVHTEKQHSPWLQCSATFCSSIRFERKMLMQHCACAAAVAQVLPFW